MRNAQLSSFCREGTCFCKGAALVKVFWGAFPALRWNPELFCLRDFSARGGGVHYVVEPALAFLLLRCYKTI